jgi:hypothetical protein
VGVQVPLSAPQIIKDLIRVGSEMAGLFWAVVVVFVVLLRTLHGLSALNTSGPTALATLAAGRVVEMMTVGAGHSRAKRLGA